MTRLPPLQADRGIALLLAALMLISLPVVGASVGTAATAERTEQSADGFQINITGTNGPVEAGDRLTVTATVTNDGQSSKWEQLTLRADNGTVVDRQWVWLWSDEERNVTLSWDTGSAAVDSDSISVSGAVDEATTDVTIYEPGDGPEFAVSVDDAALESTSEGRELNVTATVSNDGNVTGTQTIQLRKDEGTLLAVSEESLEPGEERAVTFSVTLDESEEIDTAVVKSDDDSDSAAVTQAAPDPSELDLRIDEATLNSTSNDARLDITATISNDGPENVTEEIQIRDEDERLIRLRQETVGGGEQKTVTYTVAPVDESDLSTVTLRTANASDTADVEFDVPTDDAAFDLSIDEAVLSSTNNTDQLTVTATISNDGPENVTEEIQIRNEDERLIRLRQETVGAGEQKTVTYTVTPVYESDLDTVTLRTPDASDTADVELEQPTSGPEFEVAIEDAVVNATDEGDQIDVTATVSNDGDETDTQSITLRKDDGTLLAVSDETLEPGEEQMVAFSVTLDESEEIDTAVVESRNDSDSAAVTQKEPASFSVTVDNATLDTAGEGKNLTVTTTVANDGGETDTQDIQLRKDEGTLLAVSDETLERGEERTITFSVTLDESEEIDTAIVESRNDSDSAAVTQKEPAEFSVTVDDAVLESTSDGRELNVTATIANDGDEPDTQNVRLRKDDGTLLAVSDDTLDPGEERTITFSVTLDESEEIDTAIVESDDDSDSAAVEE
ncbi:hypothetical protein NDI56_09455 [Haloarcula sp. S1CR25-12]|uniref:CARDB domain-containing protein n=1 Tax=Haloarcula saliterrae TaxID=2950534 RepID=A0ABU2FBK8_9EURY|nr:hypothetical protein [Haloarcula sp. S1CR25-12]MDS0259616.1 hypothetical protein [Haloarcula sp. S1CR25-12]